MTNNKSQRKPTSISRATKPSSKPKTTTAKAVPRSSSRATEPPASRQGDQRHRNIGDWRSQTLARLRELIVAAVPAVVEEIKWRKPSNAMAGVPVWSHHGIICTGETYQAVVKLTFAQGASLPDPQRLFNSSLDGNTRRAIDVHEGEQIDAAAFQALVKAAAAHNASPARPPKTGQQARPKPKSQPAVSKRKQQTKQDGVVLLAGGNPQIAKADGDAPVQAYIAAMPGWKSDLGKRLDAIIMRSVPQAKKAVRWNSPFYGMEGQGWFLSFHVLTRYVKVTFFRGASLNPLPPGAGKDKDARWIDIYEDDRLDERQLAAWVKQAAAIPGWSP